MGQGENPAATIEAVKIDAREKTLKDKGIRTVVALGTQAQTSVLHTGGEAALRGFKVVVPVDGMSADDLFPELYTA